MKPEPTATSDMPKNVMKAENEKSAWTEKQKPKINQAMRRCCSSLPPRMRSRRFFEAGILTSYPVVVVLLSGWDGGLAIDRFGQAWLSGSLCAEQNTPLQ